MKIELLYDSIGTKKRTNNFIEEEKIGSAINRAQLEKAELYTSLFGFDDNIINYKDYNGNIYLRRNMILDIDKHDNLEEVKSILSEYTDYELYSSGKGHHIHFNSDVLAVKENTVTHLLVRDIIKNIFKDKVDNIYDRARVLREVGTINKKNGKYKVLLSNHTAKQVKQMILPANFYIPQRIERKEIPVGNYRSPCLTALLNKPSTNGERHYNALRIVSGLKREGMDEHSIENHLMDKFGFNLYEAQKTSMFNGTYGCHDELLSSHCDTNCIHYFKRPTITIVEMKEEPIEIINMVSEQRRTKYIYNCRESEVLYRQSILDPNRIKINLRDFLHMDHNYYMYGGELVIIIGDTKVGKTAFVQNLTLYAKEYLSKVLYCSFEVGRDLLFRRFIQIENNLTKTEVDNFYRNEMDELTNGLDNLFLTTEIKSIKELNELAKEFPLIIVDTIDGVKEYGDSILRLERIALGLKEISVKNNTIVIGIHHISKHSTINMAGETKPLSVHSGKGSSSIEQKADKVIGVENKDIIVEGISTHCKKITSLASRDESNFTVNVKINFDTFNLTHIHGTQIQIEKENK